MKTNPFLTIVSTCLLAEQKIQITMVIIPIVVVAVVAAAAAAYYMLRARHREKVVSSWTDLKTVMDAPADQIQPHVAPLSGPDHTTLRDFRIHPDVAGSYRHVDVLPKHTP